MFNRINIEDELARHRHKTRSGGDKVIFDATRILKQDLFTENKILENLVQYNRAFEVVNEEDVDSEMVYSIAEIKKIAVLYRLKFLESKLYKSDIPYEAVLKIKYLDDAFKKELKFFRVLAPAESFRDKGQQAASILFAKTNYDNYYLVHRWGAPLSRSRRLKFWPLRYFENLFISLLIITLIITLSLPSRLISLDRHAEYWSGYRAAAFFHLLIFNMGVTAYFTFAFAKNFSSSIWNSEKDFD